ncbi:hypothetical protein [Shewanella maritima]|nr:hypothetical protein [Shewanella maritima]
MPYKRHYTLEQSMGKLAGNGIGEAGINQQRCINSGLNSALNIDKDCA